MTRVRVTLKGTTLDACNRILTQTPIESYSELFSMLLRRYEQDFIQACNGFLVPSSSQIRSTMVNSVQPVNPQPKEKEIDQQLPIKTHIAPPQPKMSAKQMLMDFED